MFSVPAMMHASWTLEHRGEGTPPSAAMAADWQTHAGPSPRCGLLPPAGTCVVWWTRTSAVRPARYGAAAVADGRGGSWLFGGHGYPSVAVKQVRFAYPIF